MSDRVTLTGDNDRDYEAWLKRLAAQLARSIVETVLEADDGHGGKASAGGE
jgi:hypothetical protein